MKTIKLALTMTAFIIAVATHAIERPKLSVLPVNTEMAVVAISNETPAFFEISVVTKSGEVVYYRQTNEPVTEYHKIFDFKNLAFGKYTLNLKVNDTRVSSTFEKSSEGISVGKNKMSFDPWFAYSDNLLKLSYLNFNEENVELFLYGNNGLVYQTRLGKEFSITKGYDLSKLEKGNYRAVLSSSSDEFTYYLSK